MVQETLTGCSWPWRTLGTTSNLQSLGVLPPVPAVLSGDQAVSKRELENLSTHGSLKIILRLSVSRAELNQNHYLPLNLVGVQHPFSPGAYLVSIHGDMFPHLSPSPL